MLIAHIFIKLLTIHSSRLLVSSEMFKQKLKIDSRVSNFEIYMQYLKLTKTALPGFIILYKSP